MRVRSSKMVIFVSFARYICSEPSHLRPPIVLHVGRLSAFSTIPK